MIVTGIDFEEHIINFHIRNASNKKRTTLNQNIRRSINKLKRNE